MACSSRKNSPQKQARLSNGSRKLANHIFRERKGERERENRKKGEAIKLLSLTPVKSILRQAPPPKGFLSFPNRASNGDQVFKYFRLWGTFLLHSNPNKSRVNICLVPLWFRVVPLTNFQTLSQPFSLSEFDSQDNEALYSLRLDLLW